MWQSAILSKVCTVHVNTGETLPPMISCWHVTTISRHVTPTFCVMSILFHGVAFHSKPALDGGLIGTVRIVLLSSYTSNACRITFTSSFSRHDPISECRTRSLDRTDCQDSKRGQSETTQWSISLKQRQYCTFRDSLVAGLLVW